jgi:ketosteroid isomerase-like protein
MLRRIVPATAALAAIAGAADVALNSMVDTERAFARLSAEKGMRAAFLAYIADDGVGFRPGPVPLKETMRNDPEPSPGLRLLWEPRYGDIAVSGDLGYITGPFTVESPAPDGGIRRRQGCFFSIWRLQTGGEWRNVLDIGVRLPEAAPFAPGFTRAPHAGRFTGKGAAEKATRSMRNAEEDFHRAARDTSFAIALGTVLDPLARIHRDGRAPLTSRDEALRALAGAGPLAEAATLFAAAAASGDLGYTYGRYLFAGTGGESGHYARAWVRDAAGAWRLAADITSPDAGRP